MFKKLCVIILSLGLLMLLLVGCSNNTQSESTGNATTVKEEEIPASTAIQQLAEESITGKNDKASDIQFEDYKRIDNLVFSAFSFKNDQSEFYGFVVAEQDSDVWKLSYYEEYPNDQEQSVAVYQFVGSYPGTENRVFHITAGYINDEQIAQVTLYYPNSNIKILKLAEDQHGFLDIAINSDDSLLKIEGNSSKEKTIYQKDFDKS